MLTKHHGEAVRGRRTKTYRAWLDMRKRCYTKSHSPYPYYGGRGITVCDRWDSFVNFKADMGECPTGMTLDRIDSDGNYEPGNCRWATRTEQNRNRSISKLNTQAVLVIRYARKCGVPVWLLASLHKVHRQHIWRVITRECW